MKFDGVRKQSTWVVSRLPLGLIVLSVGILAAFLAISRSPFTVHVSGTVGRFLGTLALAQASILAIVFSVVILAVQLTASKYSNQITDIYVKSPAFVVTFVMFLVSIGFDMALIYSHPTLPATVTKSLVYVAGGLASVVAIWLVYFIQFTFTQLTPAGIVAMFEDDITPERSLRRLRSTRDDHRDLEMNHPLLSLYSLTVQAIQNEERFMAIRALRELGTQMIEFHEGTVADDPLDDETVDLMYEPVLTVYIPDIVETGQETGMEEIAEQGLDWMYRIGRTGNPTSTDRVARIASNGFEDVIDRHATDPAKHQTFVTAWEKWGMLVKELCTDAEVDTIQHVFSGFEQQLNLVEKQEHPEWVRQQVLFCFFSDVQQCHETLLDRFGPSVEDLDIPWEQRVLPGGDEPDAVAAQLLIKCRNLLVLFSSIVLERLLETGDYPIRFHSFQGLWADICSYTVGHAPDEYSRTVCEIYIEVAFVSVLYEQNPDEATVGPQGRIDVWASTLERIARGPERAPVAAAFDAILDDTTTRYLSVSSYTPITRTDAYPELVERIRDATGA